MSEHASLDPSCPAPKRSLACGVGAGFRVARRRVRAGRAAARVWRGLPHRLEHRAPLRRARAPDREPRIAGRGSLACGARAGLRAAPLVPHAKPRVPVAGRAPAGRCTRACRSSPAAQSFSQQTAHSAHEFRRATQDLSRSSPLFVGYLARGCLIRGGMEFVYMSTENPNALPSTAGSEASKPKLHPAPSFVWMVIPVALLALLAFLSR